MLSLFCIVEGHGEVNSVPALIRRIAEREFPTVMVKVPPAMRQPKSSLVIESQLHRAVTLAVTKTAGRGGVLILVDADEDCPAQLGPRLAAMAQAARSDVPIGAVVAKWEFESWFLAAAASLRGKRRLGNDLVAPDNPEVIQDAKGWLSQRMVGNNKYEPTVDQAALTQLFDMDAARQASPSFDKLYREVVRLLEAVASKPTSQSDP